MSPAPSFRDPSGFCFAFDSRIFRIVSPESVAELEAFLNSAGARRFASEAQLIPTRKLDAAEIGRLRENAIFRQIAAGQEQAVVFEHERVAFPSYPYEWTPEMLFAAGRLTLDLAQTALEEEFGLKDATPYNVLFRGSRPVFIDLLSFERRTPGDAVWKPYAQFVRTFLLPLLVNRRWGIPLADIFTTHRDGLQAEEVYRMCRPLQRLQPPFLTLVSLPAWLASKGEDRAIYRRPPLADPEKARFIVRALLGRLRRALEKLAPRAGKNSVWSGYMGSHSYTEAAFQAKRDFVEAALREIQPRRVLDVGANTGHFSRLAARAGAAVVAIDSDPACMGLLWQQAQSGQENILPLVIDLARPSAGLGWRNRECPGFLDRAAGNFDTVFMLAVLHHLLVTERVPLTEVMQLAAELTTGWLIIEFVAPADEMFRRLLRGRDHLFADLDQKVFEAACRRHFEIRRSLPLPGTQRCLYLLRKQNANA